MDDRNRALITIRVANHLNGAVSEILVWIDTAFDGHLVLSRDLIRNLNLDSLVETEAILADGSKIVMESYFYVVDWFGQKVPFQVIENDGRFPLLGTDLLEGRNIYISYGTKIVEIT